jgi:hypothetical protein
MDLNTGQETTKMRYEASEEKELRNPEPVGNAVNPECMQARIAEDNLHNIAGCRITLKNRINIFTKILYHGFTSE